MRFHPRRFRRSDDGVMQIVEAMLALSILILAITWAVNVSQRPSDAPAESDDLRYLTRQALERIDEPGNPDGQGRDSVADYLRPCRGNDLALQIAALLDDPRINIYLDGRDESTFIGSTAGEEGERPDHQDILPAGRHTSVVRYLVNVPGGGNACESPGLHALRVEVWRF